MRAETELSAAVRAAMKRKNLSNEQLAGKLKRSPGTIEKLLCGEIVPSAHMEKELIEILGISDQRVKKMAERRLRKTATEETATKDTPPQARVPASPANRRRSPKKPTEL